MKEIIEKETEKIERYGFGYKPIDYDDIEYEIEQFRESFNRRTKIAEEVLKTWDKARNSDRLLDWECLRTEFPEIQVTSSKEMVIFKIPKAIVKHLPSPESYTRARRKLIANAFKDENFDELEELMPTNPAVIIKRSKREKAIKEYFKRNGYKYF